MQQFKRIALYIAVALISAFGVTGFATFVLEFHIDELIAFSPYWQWITFGLTAVLAFGSFYLARLILFLDKKFPFKFKALRPLAYALIATALSRLVSRFVDKYFDTVGKLFFYILMAVFVQTIIYLFVLLFMPKKPE